MEKPVLNDKDQFPADEVIFSHLGEKKGLWISFFNELHQTHPDFIIEWRYYKDGQSWLMKVIRKKKTVCWISVFEKGFSATFYFSDKFEETIYNSSISEDLKESFRNGKHYGKIRGLTILFSHENDIEDAEALIEISLKK
ncbi:MAG: DUF3788 domain-containing protein [Saprospiraceae bacterium]|nr:DUF3788 domain-containing protein [Saprospiraceae bacterium]